MKVISVRNVHQALPEACHQVLTFGTRRESRNGPVVKLAEPLTVHLQRPQERVLLWPERDANPFFHFFESLWMLAGRDDVAWIERFNARMREYSDNGTNFHGAYGARWRHVLGGDQLVSVARALTLNPDCRRQVISMWQADRDLGANTKDVPCNLQCVVQRGDRGELNMMVTNRSNDIVWGMLGANAVHFSVLLEYLAAAIGCDVGQMWQVSMNAHTYVGTHGEMVRKMADHAPMPPARRTDPYGDQGLDYWPLVSLPSNRWLRELQTFMRAGATCAYDDPFFQTVAVPLLNAWEARKNKHKAEAYQHIAMCAAPDWQRAALEWCERRDSK